ncbi:MAG: serine hydrolase [Myxococcales bacterium]|nr:serine hydrolase [Myxococcales bacterium]
MRGHASGLAAGMWCAAVVTTTSCAMAPPPAETARGVDVEAVVEAELDRLVDEGATRAAIVVLDPETGRVLAASGRGPEGAGEADRVVDMGSTIKPLTIAAALDAGLDPTQRFSGEGGAWHPDPATLLRDVHPREWLTAEEVLIHSSNIGAGKIVEAVGEAPIAAYLAANGVEVPAPTSWPAHGAGIGTTTSPRRLAAAYAVFANGGQLIEPTTNGRGLSRPVLSPVTARVVVDMLEAAVGDDGTGHRARVEGVRVAGKTGTTGDGAAVFAGLAPVVSPRYVIVVRAERPDGAWGGLVAAPSFSRLAATLLAP